VKLAHRECEERAALTLSIAERGIETYKRGSRWISLFDETPYGYAYGGPWEFWNEIEIATEWIRSNWNSLHESMVLDEMKVMLCDKIRNEIAKYHGFPYHEILNDQYVNVCIQRYVDDMCHLSGWPDREIMKIIHGWSENRMKREVKIAAQRIGNTINYPIFKKDTQ
jgi:hypothetical protein